MLSWPNPNFLHQGQWSYFGQGGDHFERVAHREFDRDVPIVTTGHAAAKLGRGRFRNSIGLSTWDTQGVRRRPRHRELAVAGDASRLPVIG